MGPVLEIDMKTPPPPPKVAKICLSHEMRNVHKRMKKKSIFKKLSFNKIWILSLTIQIIKLDLETLSRNTR